MKRILAIILAGGRVDELSVLTLNRPKSAVPFGGMYRIIDFPLSNLMHSGIEKVGVLSQYHSSSLVRHIGIGSSWDMVGRDRGVMVLPPFKAASNSDWYKGTADAVSQNLQFIEEFEPDLVLILSGDHIYHLDYNEVIDYHLTKKADVTAVFKQVPLNTAHRFGVASIDDEDGHSGGRITAYHEKPTQPTSSWASLTIYIFNTDVLKRCLLQFANNSKSFEFGQHILPRLVPTNRLYGYKFYDYWGYSRTIPEYWSANMDLLADEPLIDLAKWQVRTNLDHRNLKDRTPSIISETAAIEDSIVYTGAVIEGSVTHSVIFPGVRIEAGARVSNSVVMFDTIIKKGSTLNKTILDTDICVGENCTIGEASAEGQAHASDLIKIDGITVVGQHVTLPANMVIGANCIINPHKKENEFKEKFIPSGKLL
ncbi:MAG: glucose-1-phosphate adenylyltransferase family protein [Candidatus Zhuqueibacterota bacterium]